MIKKKDERILNLDSCLEETKSCFLEERKKSSLLQKKVLSLEQSLDMLECGTEDLHCELEQNESEIASLCQQIHDACQKKQIDSEETYSSRAYTSNVRALYYSLLALRLPPTVIKPAVKNVIAHLFPSVSEEIRLPGKSCTCVARKCQLLIEFIKLSN